MHWNDCHNLKKCLILLFIIKILHVQLTEKTLLKNCSKWSTDETNQTDDRATSILMRLFHRPINSSCRIIHDFGGLVQRMFFDLEDIASNKGLGNFDGQKSVCMEPKVKPDPNNCTVYSFGINYEWSFDKDFEKYGCQVYSFDPSMSQGDHQHSAKVQFFAKGISDGNIGRDPQTGWKMLTLESAYQTLRSRHGDVPIDYLKLDVEMSEWKVIPQIILSGMLDHVKQLAIEIHFEDDMPKNVVYEYLRILKSVEDAGMVLFALRPNMFSLGYLLEQPNFLAFELAWYNIKYFPKKIN